MTPRDVVRRLLATVVVAAVALVGLSLAHLQPDPVRVAVLVLLLVLGVGLALDGLDGEASPWDAERDGAARTRGRDAVAVAHLRALEGHLSARRPNASVRDRLRALADGVLGARHGVRLESVEGRHLLGPEVLAVVDGPPRRLDVRTIATCLERIEHL